MEGVIFCGIQASGQTTFYRERFFDTHVRISPDMLRTRRREWLLLTACLDGRQPFVVDNTNPTAAGCARYIVPSLAAGFEVLRNTVALAAPTRDEGFKRVYRVEIVEGRGFDVTARLPADPHA